MNKQSQIKRTAGKLRNGHAEQSWLRRFWLLLGSIALISAFAIFQFVQAPRAELDEEVYVSISVKTAIGLNQQLVVCELSLLIDQHQEKGIQKRQQLLQVVVGDALATAYENGKRPGIAAVRENLYLAINQKLPRKLQVQDVLIQQLVVGIG